MTTKDFQPTQNMNEETDIQTPTDNPTGLPASAGSGTNVPNHQPRGISPYTGERIATVRDRLDGMPVDVWAKLTNCPGIHHMMTGITDAGFNGRGDVRVRYEDGTQREAKAPDWFLDKILEELTLMTFAEVFVK